MSLIDEAKKLEHRKRKVKNITADELDLAVAVIKGNVGILAATKSMNYKSPNGYSYRLMMAVKFLYENDRLIIK